MRPRPHVEYHLDHPMASVFERFDRALQADASLCDGFVGRQEVTLHIREERRRMWSPWLQLRVESEGEGTLLMGKMGPQPNLWTAFIFVYSVLVAIFAAGSMYGFIQMTLGQGLDGLYAAAAALLGLGLACGMDLTGRRMGEAQMGVIRGFVERVIKDAPQAPG